jgi:hypothetical protein
MTDSSIIWKFLSREFPDDHVVIYLYVCGNVRSPQNAMDKAMLITEKIFCPPLDVIFVKTVLKGFLDMKKEQYKKALIKVKPIY